MKSGGGSIRAHGGDGRGGNVSSRVHGEDGGGGDGRGGGSVRVHGKADGSIRVQGGDNRGGSNVLSRIHGEGGVPFHVHGGGDSSIRDQGGNGGGSARSGGSSNAYGGNDHGELMVADRFTSLPDDLLGRVLSFLNVDEVARTAILSKRMRHFWKTMVLVIDDTRFKTIPNLQFVLGLVKGVMSNHTGFVERLALKRLPLTTLFGLMGSWMIGSAFCRINDLCLSFPGDKFVLPQFVFGFRSLKLLDLCNCIVIETMISLPSLTSLRLAEVDISEPTLHSIISTAKKLHTLVLQWNGGYSTLSLSVPDLCCLIVSVNPSLWDTKHQQLKNVYIHNSPKLYRLLVSTVDKHHLSVTVSGIWMPRILGHCLGTGAISLQHSNKKLEDICISNLYVAQTWATVKILSLEVGNQDIASLESYLGLFPSLETLHVYLRDSSVIKDVDNSDRLYHLGIPVECLPRNLRASEVAQVLFNSEGESRYPSLEENMHARDPFILNYAAPYHTFKVEAPAYILQSEFVITNIDVVNNGVGLPQLDQGYIFDEVSRVEGHCEDLDLYLLLDVATWVYQMNIGDRFIVTLAAAIDTLVLLFAVLLGYITTHHPPSSQRSYVPKAISVCQLTCNQIVSPSYKKWTFFPANLSTFSIKGRSLLSVYTQRLQEVIHIILIFQRCVNETQTIANALNTYDRCSYQLETVILKIEYNNFMATSSNGASFINVDDHTKPVTPQLLDPKERKRKRERDRYKNMTDQQRAERNRKRREAYQRNKSDVLLHATTKDCNSTFHVENRKWKYSQCTTLCATPTLHDKALPPKVLSDEQKEAKRVRERVWYANMTSTEKQSRFHRQYVQDALRRSVLTEEWIEEKCERRRVYNMTPEQKQARRDREKNTL